MLSGLRGTYVLCRVYCAVYVAWSVPKSASHPAPRPTKQKSCIAACMFFSLIAACITARATCHGMDGSHTSRVSPESASRACKGESRGVGEPPLRGRYHARKPLTHRTSKKKESRCVRHSVRPQVFRPNEATAFCTRGFLSVRSRRARRSPLRLGRTQAAGRRSMAHADGSGVSHGIRALEWTFALRPAQGAAARAAATPWTLHCLFSTTPVRCPSPRDAQLCPADRSPAASAPSGFVLVGCRLYRRAVAARYTALCCGSCCK